MLLERLFTPRRKTWLYKVNPAFKFVVSFSLMLIVFFNSKLAFTFYFMVLAALLLFGFSGYALRRILLFSLPIFLSFISSATTLILFGRGEKIWWSWGLLKISEESFGSGLLIGCKILCIGFLSLMFLLTSRPMMLFYALMQQYKLPPKYAYSFIASIRMIPMIIEELQTRANALKVRGVKFSKGIKGVYERLRLFTIPLFAQSIRRAQRVAVAIEAKRFQMKASRTFYYPTSYSKWDVIYLGTMAGSFVCAIVLAFL